MSWPVELARDAKKELARLPGAVQKRIARVLGMPCQIVFCKVWDWLRDDDPARVQRVTAALWQMEKLDLATLERAAKG